MYVYYNLFIRKNGEGEEILQILLLSLLRGYKKRLVKLCKE